VRQPLCVLAAVAIGCSGSDAGCQTRDCQSSAREEQAPHVLGPWTTKAAIPEPAALVPVGVVNGVFYVVGSILSSSLFAYDPVSDRWTRKAVLPTRRDFEAAGVVNGILYVIGGRGTSDGNYPKAYAIVEAYDPASNLWTTKAAMPTPRFGAAAGVVNGIVYVAGGYGAGGALLSTVEAYNPATNTWTTRRAMPTSRTYAAAGVLNDILYVAGGEGTNGFETMGTLEAYDPTSDTWTTRAAMPTARSTGAAGVIDGILYVAGGGGLATLEAYDPTTNKWTTKTAMPTARSFAPGGAVNGILYVVGGSGYQPWLTIVEAYNPALDKK
jgi:N-acetylneuraminic acid mutarotase